MNPLTLYMAPPPPRSNIIILELEECSIKSLKDSHLENSQGYFLTHCVNENRKPVK